MGVEHSGFEVCNSNKIAMIVYFVGFIINPRHN